MGFKLIIGIIAAAAAVLGLTVFRVPILAAIGTAGNTAGQAIGTIPSSIGQGINQGLDPLRDLINSIMLPTLPTIPDFTFNIPDPFQQMQQMINPTPTPAPAPTPGPNFFTDLVDSITNALTPTVTPNPTPTPTPIIPIVPTPTVTPTPTPNPIMRMLQTFRNNPQFMAGDPFFFLPRTNTQLQLTDQAVDFYRNNNVPIFNLGPSALSMRGLDIFRRSRGI